MARHHLRPTSSLRRATCHLSPAPSSSPTSSPSIPHRTTLAFLLLLHPLFLLTTCYFLVSPLLSPAPSAAHSSTWLASFATRLSRSSAATLHTALYKSLVAVFVVQGWWCSRLASWCDAAGLPDPSARIDADAHPSARFDAAPSLSARDASLPCTTTSTERGKTSKTHVEDLAITLLLLPLLILLLLPLPVLFSGSPSLLLSCHLSLLLLLPLVHILGVPFFSSSLPWLALVRLDLKHHPYLIPLAANTVGVSVTTLLASLLAALDWHTSWQTWPLPNVFGAVAGVVLADWAVLVWVCI
ncbi:hypothetical protein ACQY0O_005367 [Thecaphora frezii]